MSNARRPAHPRLSAGRFFVRGIQSRKKRRSSGQKVEVCGASLPRKRLSGGSSLGTPHLPGRTPQLREVYEQAINSASGQASAVPHTNPDYLTSRKPKSPFLLADACIPVDSRPKPAPACARNPRPKPAPDGDQTERGGANRRAWLRCPRSPAAPLSSARLGYMERACGAGVGLTSTKR